MGKAKTRRLSCALKQAHTEGQGVWELTLVTRNNLFVMLMNSAAGDAEATRICRLVTELIRQIAAHPSVKNAPLCLLCDNTFWRDQLPGAVAILNAHHDTPTNGIVSGICEACCRVHGEHGLKAALLTAYQRQLQIDDFRELPPLSTPGSA